MKFKPVKTSRLYEEVVEQIKDLIRTGQIKPGDRFPAERELAGKIGVSRAVLREAFRVLESMGLVRSKRGGGRYLRDYNRQNIYKTGDVFLNLEKAVLLDIAEARRLLETQIIKKAIDEANDQDILAIKEVLTLMENVSEEKYRESDLDLEFHLAIASATHNFALYDLLEAQIHLLIDLEQKHLLAPERRKDLCHEHRAILRAITARDKRTAEQIMDNHLRNLIKALIDI